MHASTAFEQDLHRLIATPSISSLDPSLDQSNAAVIDYLATALQRLGFKVTTLPLPNNPQKLNLFAQLGSGEGGLLLAGHSDTVPFDAGRWQRDPFKLVEESGRLYGLGVIDMKGFFAFALEAVRQLRGQRLAKPLYIVATADEEISMDGARVLAEQLHALGLGETITPEFALIGEPTNLVPIIGHKGHLAESITILGKSGHSSDPNNGINALELMHPIIGALLQLQRELEQERDPHFAIPYPTLNLGAIRGGDSPNRICGECELQIDLRPTPKAPPEVLLAQIDKLLMQVEPSRISRRSLHTPIPAHLCAADLPLVRYLEELSGQRAQTVNYCTEAPFIQQLGCQTVIFGVGDIAQAHQPDEYLECRFIEPMLVQLTGLIARCCQ